MNKTNIQKIKDFIKNHESEIINDVRKLIKMRSDFDQKSVSPETPRGKYISQGFKQLEAFLENDHEIKTWYFDTETKDYGYYTFGSEDAKKIVGFIFHFDTVGMGLSQNWLKGDPLSGIVKDGFIYGRGSVDDKSPIVALLWAKKILDNMKVKIPFKISAFIGGDEETARQSQFAFLKKHQTPNVSLVPDAEFPLCFIEKTIYKYELILKNDDTKIISIESPDSVNVVPAYCKARVKIPYKILKSNFDLYLEENNIFGKITKVDDQTTDVFIEGVPIHAIYNTKGVNAISYFFDFLGSLDNNSRVTPFVNKFLHQNFFGNQFNINRIDRKLGTGTNFNLGTIKKVGNDFYFGLNIRFLKYKITRLEIEENILKVAKKWIGMNNVEFNAVGQPNGGVTIDVDTPFWKLVYKNYQDTMQDYKSKPYFTAGGTYSQFFPNAAAFGPILPSQTYNAHCDNEKMPLKSLFATILIFVTLICELSENPSVIE